MKPSLPGFACHWRDVHAPTRRHHCEANMKTMCAYKQKPLNVEVLEAYKSTVCTIVLNIILIYYLCYIYILVFYAQLSWTSLSNKVQKKASETREQDFPRTQAEISQTTLKKLGKTKTKA